MSWRIEGQSFEFCSCKMFCPCWLGPAEPDQGWCSGVFMFDIQQGSSDGVDLAGCKAAVAFDWPGDFWSGQGTARLYIDQATSGDQRREVEAIFSGQKGGHLETVLSQVVSKVLTTQIVKIDLEWGDNPSLTVGSIGEVTLQPLKDETGRPATVEGAAAAAAFQLPSLRLASSKGSSWSDPEMRAWEGDSGTLHSFKWSA